MVLSEPLICILMESALEAIVSHHLILHEYKSGDLQIEQVWGGGVTMLHLFSSSMTFLFDFSNCKSSVPTLLRFLLTSVIKCISTLIYLARHAYLNHGQVIDIEKSNRLIMDEKRFHLGKCFMGYGANTLGNISMYFRWYDDTFISSSRARYFFHKISVLKCM